MHGTDLTGKPESESTEEPTELPGFGIDVALVALLAAALLAVRRADEN